MRRPTRGPRPDVVVLSGAGISAPSGLATFRAPGATSWRDVSAERFMHASTYPDHLTELWAWSESLRSAAAAAEPNAAHRACAENGVGVITCNVDGLHARAGSDAVELHGTVFRGRCRRGHRFDVADGTVAPGAPVPSCVACGAARARPDVLLFGEVARRAERDRAWWLLAGARVLVVVGSSGAVWPSAGYPDEVAARGGRTVLVNAEPWDSHDFDEVHLGDAAELLGGVLADLVARVRR